MSRHDKAERDEVGGASSQEERPARSNAEFRRAGGAENAAMRLPEARAEAAPAAPRGSYVLVTGGAGFIGLNLAQRLVREGRQVLIYDDLSRPGARQNLERLLADTPRGIAVRVADVRDRGALKEAVRRAEAVYHFAAQVAVTTSLGDPSHDFEVNALGTFLLLEELRARRDPPPFLLTSTNKVYGPLEDVALQHVGRRCQPVDEVLRRTGIDEGRSLDFHSPYGCSKGTADQYVLDYARCFGLPATVFRMSCIYGPHQNGNEDQGWVAHFLIGALTRAPLTIYGDGRQVRDVLFVDDLLDALLLAHERIDSTAGRAFNVGGGPDHTLSLLELLDELEDLHIAPPREARAEDALAAAAAGSANGSGGHGGAGISNGAQTNGKNGAHGLRRAAISERRWVRFAPQRVADQHWYVSDFRRFARLTGWRPRVAPREGILRLREWLTRARGLRPGVRLIGSRAP